MDASTYLIISWLLRFIFKLKKVSLFDQFVHEFIVLLSCNVFLFTQNLSLEAVIKLTVSSDELSFLSF